MLKKDDYYKASSDWAYEMYQSQGLWLRRSLVSLVVLAFLLCLSLLSTLYLFPLKENVPYLYAFDHATGEITKIGTLDKTPLSGNWELTKYLIIRYVTNYESYDYDNVEVPYQLVWAQSNDHVRSIYDNTVKSNNKQSAYHLYGKDKYITIKVISINKLNEKTVEVKFEKTLHDRITNSNQTTQKEAIIKWDFVNPETNEKMLERDPLGFKVIYYQVSSVNL